jgi:hypothetical protein
MWHYATNIVITNNTVFQFYEGIVVGSAPETGVYADYCVVNNNIVRGVINAAVSEMKRVGSHNIVSNNLTYQSAIDYALAPGNRAMNPIHADPLFVNWRVAGGGDYHLQSGSPAIDAGTSWGAPPDDFDGLRRPQGKSVDVGAYEYLP